MVFYRCHLHGSSGHGVGFAETSRTPSSCTRPVLDSGALVTPRRGNARRSTRSGGRCRATRRKPVTHALPSGRAATGAIHSDTVGGHDTRHTTDEPRPFDPIEELYVLS